MSQVLNSVQESGEARVRIMALETSGAEKLAKIGALESLELELLYENRRLQHELVVL